MTSTEGNGTVAENSNIKVLALVGSLRSASINRQIAELAADVAPDGVTVTIFEGLGDLPFYNEEIDDSMSSDVEHAPAPVAALRGDDVGRAQLAEDLREKALRYIGCLRDLRRLHAPAGIRGRERDARPERVDRLRRWPRDAAAVAPDGIGRCNNAHVSTLIGARLPGGE